MPSIFTVLKFSVLAVVATALLFFALLLLIGLLQAFGVVKGIPLRYTLRSLALRWRTTALTALAFTLVVALTVLMQAFVNGMDRLTEGSGDPANVLVMADGSTDELFSNLGFGDVTQIEHEPGVARDEEGTPLASWETYMVVNQPIPNAPPGGRRRRFIQVRGIKDPVRSGRVHNLALREDGAWFSRAGVRPVQDSQGREEVLGEAVLGAGIARELGHDQGKPSLVPGDVFELGPRRWVVTGVMTSPGSTFDSEVWAKQQLAGETFGKKETWTTVVLRSRDDVAAKELAHNLAANYKKPAVAAQTEPEYYERLSNTNKQFAYAIRVVAIVMAIGGVFGVMNTMFAAISQRTKDVGVLRILGYRRWQVLTSFFLESVFLAVLGGLLGCALGWLCDGWTASSIISSGQGGGKSVVLKLVVDARTLGSALAFAVLMGCVGGVFPALSAMRLRPLEALR